MLSNFAFNFNLRRYNKRVLLFTNCDAPLKPGTGLHSLTTKLNLRTFGKTSLPLELNLSTIGPHPRVNQGDMGDKVGLS